MQTKRHWTEPPTPRTRLARLSHDVDNLLMVISGHAELARHALPADHTARNSIDLITIAVELARTLTDASLGPGRRKAPAHSRLDLSQLVADSAQLIRGMMRDLIEVEIDTTAGAGLWIEGDATQLLRALLNLADNARYAMGDSGRLSILLRSKNPTGNGSGNGSSGPDDTAEPAAELVVADTGVGIPEEEQTRLFEPFFSTKSSGTRHGLGLWQVHEVVSEHGGTIDVWSRSGCGTKFTITLPTCAPPESIEPRVSSEPGLPERSASVLVIEPDDEDRRVIAASLRSAGYHVIALADHRHARRRALSRSPIVRSAIVDVDQMDPARTHDLNELRDIQGLRGIVFLASDPSASSSEQRPCDQLLIKPFRVDALRSAVARSLLEPTYEDSHPC